MQKKRFTIVFRAMIVVGCLILLTFIVSFYYTTHSGLFKKIDYSKLYFAIIFWPCLFIIETIIFWCRRERVQINALFILYLVCTAITFVITPYIIMILNSTGVSITNISSRNSFFKTVKFLHAVIFWVSLIMGHAFFIVTIAKSFKNKVTSEIDNEQPAGILDDIADEY